MLATLGSIASQGGFDGVLWDYGNNPFNLPFVGNGYVTSDYFYAKPTWSSGGGSSYGLDVTSLQLKKSILKITCQITGDTHMPYGKKVEVYYDDGTYAVFSISNTTITEYTFNLDNTKTLKYIQVNSIGSLNPDYPWQVIVRCYKVVVE